MTIVSLVQLPITVNRRFDQPTLPLTNRTKEGRQVGLLSGLLKSSFGHSSMPLSSGEMRQFAFEM